MQTKNKKQPLLVTTDNKGVFFGYGEPTNESVITLTNAKMCIYWCSEVKGVLGLAAVGPLIGSRITPAVPQITLTGVTSITICTPAAALAWERDVWN